VARLFAIVYPDQSTGEAALETVKGLEQANYLQVVDQAFLIKSEDGKIVQPGAGHPVRSAGGKGLLLGAVVGVIFAVPVVGIAAGTAAGVAIGRHRHDADKDFTAFADAVANDLKPGNSVVIILGEAVSAERVIHDLGRHGGQLRSTDVTPDQLASFQAQVDRAAQSS
jgi:uncharacterized membrane protein